MSQNEKIAALFINMGGPRTPEDVRPFMFNLFNDVHILDLKQPLRRFVATMICMARVKRVRQNYLDIGGGSPIFDWTQKQGAGTVALLKDRYPGIEALDGYSYAAPFIGPAIDELAKKDYGRIVIVPLYPYYSLATLGSMYSDVEKARRRNDLGERLIIVPPYYDRPLYLKATLELLKESLAKMDSSRPFRVVFTAHSLPVGFILDEGDPYRQQVQSTYRAILREVPLKDSILSFQSKIGPVEWMGPSTEKTIIETGQQGFKQVLVFPLGFTCDHIETLHELDIELKHTAKSAGIETFVRGRVFNDHLTFIMLLAECVAEMLE